MDVAEAAFGFSTPDEFFSSKYLEGIATLSPTCKFEANIVDDSFFGKFVGDPCIREMTDVFLLREFVVVVTEGGVLGVVSCFCSNDLHSSGLFGIGGFGVES